MNKREERAAQRLGNWDFKTVIGGKEVSSSDIKETKERQEQSARQAQEEIEATRVAELKALPGGQLLNILNQDSVSEEQVEEGNNKVFLNLEDFCRWYSSEKQHFSEPQKEALNTLIAVSSMVTKGCKCKETERRGTAYGYYQKFITSNSETDIMDKIKEVGGFDSVSFLVVEGSEPFFKT
jgi:hypothetical protein